MPSANQVEHFVTLFDSCFLPMGMCLHASLVEHGRPFHLWIMCMDETVEEQLRRLDPPHVSLIPLREVETDALRAVKKERSRAEYYWTLTPFSFKFVFERDVDIERVTYLDADLFFFDSPRLLFEEFEQSGKDVLITDHAYDPQYDQSARNGRFCVQFITFRRTEAGRRVGDWWREKCLEWCYARAENGKFGDQKYLDVWPELFKNEVHILGRTDKTLAPWNVEYMLRRDPSARPVFFHFHSLRILSPARVRLFIGYRVKAGLRFYESYMETLRACLLRMKQKGVEPAIPAPSFFGSSSVQKYLKYFVLRAVKDAKIRV